MSEHWKVYHAWWMNRTAEEMQLCKNLYEYEEIYFKDMSLEPGEPLYEIAESLVEGYDYISLGLDNKGIRLVVKESPERIGCFNIAEREIEISPKHLNDKGTLLHELIHFYEWALSEINPALNEFLLLYFHKKLSAKISDLHERILKHTDMYYLDKLERSGGNHGILFLLKSYDLDLMCGYKLGTIFNYGGYAE